MTVWRRIVSLATVATLTGVPALLATCVVLCLPVTVTATNDGSATSASHAHHEMPSSASAHDHHAMAAASAPDAPASGHSAGDVSAAALQLSSAAHDCCPDGQAAALTAVAAGRQDTRALSATVDPCDPTVAVWLPAPRVVARGPAVSPPSPPRTSPVLRI